MLFAVWTYVFLRISKLKRKTGQTFISLKFLSGPSISLFLRLQTERMATQKHTIVYAEDDMDDLFILKQAFNKHDHIEIVHVPDGRTAMQRLEDLSNRNTLPCLVILDINMPVMSGRETLQAIRSHDLLRKLPVVLFSTSSSSADKLFAETYQAILITKPVDFSNLEMIVDQFIERCNFEVNGVVTGGSYRSS